MSDKDIKEYHKLIEKLKKRKYVKKKEQEWVRWEL